MVFRKTETPIAPVGNYQSRCKLLNSRGARRMPRARGRRVKGGLSGRRGRRTRCELRRHGPIHRRRRARRGVGVAKMHHGARPLRGEPGLRPIHRRRRAPPGRPVLVAAAAVRAGRARREAPAGIALTGDAAHRSPWHIGTRGEFYRGAPVALGTTDVSGANRAHPAAAEPRDALSQPLRPAALPAADVPARGAAVLTASGRPAGRSTHLSPGARAPVASDAPPANSIICVAIDNCQLVQSGFRFCETPWWRLRLLLVRPKHVSCVRFRRTWRMGEKRCESRQESTWRSSRRRVSSGQCWLHRRKPYRAFHDRPAWPVRPATLFFRS